MTEQSDNKATDKPYNRLDDPEYVARVNKTIEALESVSKEFETPTTMQAEHDARLEAEWIETEEKERAQIAAEKRRCAWGIMGSLIFCGVIEAPDVDITARTLDDLHAQQKILADIQFIIGHIELALDQVLL
ncbi:MAG: hypothetical protein ABI947_14395 [Chloroflexota bacterium]